MLIISVAAPPGDVYQSTLNVVRKFMEWTQLVQRKKYEEKVAKDAGLPYSSPQLEKDILTLQNFCSSAIDKSGMGHMVNLYNINTKRQQDEIQRGQRMQQEYPAPGRARTNMYQASMSTAVNQAMPQTSRGVRMGFDQTPTSNHIRHNPNIFNRNPGLYEQPAFSNFSRQSPNILNRNLGLHPSLTNNPGPSQAFNRPVSTPAETTQAPKFTDSIDLD